MNIGIRVASYAVLPLCLLVAALRPDATVKAGVAPYPPVEARFLTILPPGFLMQEKAQSDDIPLPDGKGKEETKKLCGSCHSTNLWAGQRHTREEWSAIIDTMASRGLEATDDQLEIVTTYLATYLGPKKDASSDSAPTK